MALRASSVAFVECQSGPKLEGALRALKLRIRQALRSPGATHRMPPAPHGCRRIWWQGVQIRKGAAEIIVVPAWNRGSDGAGLARRNGIVPRFPQKALAHFPTGA